MPNPKITELVRILEKKARDEINNKLPRRVGIIAVNFFNQNFRDGGFRDGGLKRWPETRRQREGEGASARYGPLLSAAPHLSRSTQAQPSPGQVRITNHVPYAGIHNEGGTITTHPTITPRMRRMAWAKVYKLAGVKKGEKLPKQLPLKAQMWKGIALTQKSKLTINAKIPQRKFIGNSNELRKKIDDIITQTLRKIMQSSR